MMRYMQTTRISPLSTRVATPPTQVTSNQRATSTPGQAQAVIRHQRQAVIRHQRQAVVRHQAVIRHHSAPAAPLYLTTDISQLGATSWM